MSTENNNWFMDLVNRAERKAVDAMSKAGFKLKKKNRECIRMGAAAGINALLADAEAHKEANQIPQQQLASDEGLPNAQRRVA